MTGYKDFTIEMTRGDDRAFQFTVKDKVTGNPIDLTNYSKLCFLAKKRVTDAEAAAIVNLTMGAGITATNPVGGVLTFEVPRAQTNALGNRRHQLLAIFLGDNPTVKRKTIQRGVLVVNTS